MERNDNAVLAVRVMGLAFLAIGLRLLVRLAGLPLIPSRMDSARAAETLRLFAAIALPPLAMAALCLALAPLLARLAARPGGEGDGPVAGEPLRIGVLLIGLLAAQEAITGLTQLAVPHSRPLAVGQLCGAVAMAAWLLLAPGGVVRLALRRADGGRDASADYVALAAGLALIGLLQFMEIGADLGRATSMSTYGPAVRAEVLMPHSVAAAGVGFLVTVVLVWASGPAARRLTGDGTPARWPGVLTPRRCIGLAVVIIAFQELLVPFVRGQITDIARVPAELAKMSARGQVLTPSEWLQSGGYVTVMAAVGVAGVLLARPLSRLLAALFYREEPDAPPADATPLLVLDVAFTLMALRVLLVGVAAVATNPSGGIGRMGTGVLLLVFRPGLSRWMVDPQELDEASLPRRRALALAPWIVLLGAWVIADRLPLAASWGFGLLASPAPAPGPNVTVFPLPNPSIEIVCAALLIVLARPLARLLSYNRIGGPDGR